MTRVPPRPFAVRKLCQSLVSLILCGVAAVACGQDSILLKGGELLVGNGTHIKNGALLIRDGKIAAAGRRVRAPRGVETVDVSGKVLTPGLIDVWTTLSAAARGGGGRFDARAADNFNRFDTDNLQAALRGGVTTVYLPARGPDGVCGMGSVVRLAGEDPNTRVLESDAALCVAVGLGRGGPLARVKSRAAFRKLWIDAKAYRRAQEDYAEKLTEYEKKLKERAESGEADTDKAKKNADKSKKNDKGKHSAVRPRRRRPPRGGANTAGNEKPKKKNAKDELKKPVEPAIDRNKELLLRALDGAFLVRVEAHRPEDILDVLDVAEEFNLALILEGASGSARLSELLGERKIPVVLPSTRPMLAFTAGLERYARPDTAAILSDAGAAVYLGSGPAGAGRSATRHLALNVAGAVGAGLSARKALQLVTRDAARLLGIDDRVGSLARGMSADVVVWSDQPFAPGARVERVYIAGKEVYSISDSGDDE